MKRWMQHISIFMLMIVVALGIFSKPAYAATDHPEFVITPDGTLTEYHGMGGDVVIPDGVTAIGARAFASCNTIKTVKFSNSVKVIKESAFDSCNELEKVTLSKQLKTIETSAFWGCRNLTSIQIPDSVTTIEFAAFCNCDMLNGIQLPKTVKKIGNYAVGFHFSDGYTLADDYAIIGENGTAAKQYADKYKVFFLTKKDLNVKNVLVKKKTETKRSVKWSKNTAVKGYEIQYATNQKFKNAKSISVSSQKNSCIIKGKKISYIRVRGIRTIAGKKYYSDWKSVRV